MYTHITWCMSYVFTCRYFNNIYKKSVREKRERNLNKKLLISAKEWIFIKYKLHMRLILLSYWPFPTILLCPTTKILLAKKKGKKLIWAFVQQINISLPLTLWLLFKVIMIDIVFHFVCDIIYFFFHSYNIIRLDCIVSSIIITHNINYSILILHTWRDIYFTLTKYQTRCTKEKERGKGPDWLDGILLMERL